VRNVADSPRSLSTPEHARRTGLIFAGGRATRLGGHNKALLEVGGRRIIDRILDALGPLVDECVLLTNDESLRDVQSLRPVFDTEPHAGVLPALLTGLAAARAERCLAVACDMPFVSRELFERMLDMDADVVIPRTDHGLEPMHAVYRSGPVQVAIRAALERGDRRMVSFLSDLSVREIGQAEWAAIDPSGLAFFNVNTPADLDEARRRA
jgi:molybdopterin-guanine dinucleotide biosynthesis protein A